MKVQMLFMHSSKINLKIFKDSRKSGFLNKPKLLLFCDFFYFHLSFRFYFT